MKIVNVYDKRFWIFRRKKKRFEVKQLSIIFFVIRILVGTSKFLLRIDVIAFRAVVFDDQLESNDNDTKYKRNIDFHDFYFL